MLTLCPPDYIFPRSRAHVILVLLIYIFLFELTEEFVLLPDRSLNISPVSEAIQFHALIEFLVLSIFIFP